MSGDINNKITNYNQGTFTSLWLRLEPITIAAFMFDWKIAFYITAAIYVALNFVLERHLASKSIKYRVITSILTGVATGLMVMLANIITSCYLFSRKFPYFESEVYFDIIRYFVFFFFIIIIGRLLMITLDDKIEKKNRCCTII
ncbi:MAG TPA: hypothetical protein DEB39_06760 [Planctomycetaceae bacterium]|nr:hypothetical protein [Planctomycetaceae bacterium]